MATRGIVGFRYKNIDKVTYNHFDSYPSALGVGVLQDCINLDINDMRQKFLEIELVKSTDTVTNKHKQEYGFKYASLSDINENNGKIDYYTFLQETQGQLLPFIYGELKIMIDSQDFIKDSLFCEWGYIVNLSTKKVEVLRGFQKSPDPSNRYGMLGNEDGYYPCRIIERIPIKDITPEYIKNKSKQYNWR